MDLTYIIPILWIIIYVAILVVFITKNERLKKEINGLEGENRRIRIEKVFQPLGQNEKQFYEFRINVRNDKIKELEQELKFEKNRIFSVRLDELIKENSILRKENSDLLTRIALLSGIGKINTEAVKLYSRCVVDDRFTMTFPPCNGKTLYMTEIRQQHFNDIVSKMKSDVEERIMKEDSSKPTESECGDTQPKKDLIENYKLKIKGFRYSGGYSEEIENSLKELGLYGIKYDSEKNKITCKFPGVCEQIDVTIESQSFIVLEFGNIQVFTNEKALERYKLDN